MFSANKKEERIMRTTAKTVVALTVLAGAAFGATASAQAQGYYYPHYRYGYYGGWRSWNGCPPHWTIQGGVCKPYRFGPWDYYGAPRYGYYGYRHW